MTGRILVSQCCDIKEKGLETVAGDQENDGVPRLVAIVFRANEDVITI